MVSFLFFPIQSWFVLTMLKTHGQMATEKMDEANTVKKIGAKRDTQLVSHPKPRLPEAVPTRNDSMFRLPEGFFKLPPNFRNYAKFISYGWGGFAVVATVVCAGTWVQHRLESKQRDSQEEAINTRR